MGFLDQETSTFTFAGVGVPVLGITSAVQLGAASGGSRRRWIMNSNAFASIGIHLFIRPTVIFL